MPIVDSTTNYSGRKVDIHIFQGVNVNKLSPITPSFGKISNFCSGIQKLIQRYAISLMTELGSQPDYPTFGTKLMSTLNNRNLSFNKADIYPIFNSASYKVVSEFRDYQAKNSGIPTDEQLNTAYLSDIIITNDSVSFKVTIIPVSGDTTEFLIPLPKDNE